MSLTALGKFTNYYGAERVVLPVIHVRADYAEVLDNIRISQDAGAAGVWLISHGDVDNETLIEIQRGAIELTGWDKIGVNLLGVPAAEALRITRGTGMGLWADNAGIHDNDTTEAERAVGIDYSGLYFGGVAFKYQRTAHDLVGVTKAATQFVDVITTSGPGTGKAASADKIITMREAAGDHPIGIASGVSIGNIASYLPYANAYLVASSVALNDDFHRLDPAKVKALVNAVQGA